MARKKKSKKYKDIRIEITESEVNRRIDQIEALDCDSELREFLINTLQALVGLDKLLGMKETTLARLRKIFNKQTEKIQPNQSDNDPDAAKSRGGRKAGQGNNSSEAYPYANQQNHQLEEHLHAGQSCPECNSGTLYEYIPGIFIKITGQPNFEATQHITEKVRCNSCGAIFEAKCEEKCSGKYDSSVSSILAILHYQASTPYYRLEKIQKQLMAPMPRSVQCQLMESLANNLLPVWKAMINFAQDCKFFYSDDTRGKVISLIRENMKLSKAERKGIFTTGIIAKDDKAQAVLFFTGRKHSGENLSDLLIDVPPGLVPQVMSDALSSNNLDQQIEYIKLLCLVHGRRNFLDLEEVFKQEVDFILQNIAIVYKNEKYIKDSGMDDAQRLKYHQEHSGAVMEKIYHWCEQKMNNKEIEPNSSLGQAIKYLLKHWEGLTGFLRHEGAALDNNEMEQKLRTPVLNRKNWLFYHNESTALMGDIILSVLKTCEVNNVNPFNYLEHVQKNAEQVKASPDQFLPWAVDLK